MNVQAVKELTKEFYKSKRQDRKDHIMSTVVENLDLRDKWLGLRQLKTGYTPQPYYRKDKNGKHTSYHMRAEETADYLATHQWGKQTENHRTTLLQTDKIIRTEVRFDLDPITMAELRGTIKKFKRRKAAGPDEIPMALLPRDE